MKLKFISKKTESKDVKTYTFEPTEELKWTAGQALRLELTTSLGREERWFSISSAPYEKRVSITTRISDSRFKSSLDRLKEGDLIEAGNVSGNFTWTDEGRKKALIAIGLGVTPFISILRQRIYEGKSVDAILIYVSRTENCAFKQELTRLSHSNEEMMIITNTKGMLSADDIKRCIPDILNRKVYISGAEPIVEMVGKEMVIAGLPQNQLVQDWFTGYDSSFS